MTDEFKWCPCCKSSMPKDDFASNKSTKSGVDGWCKACNRRKCREYYHNVYKHTERYKERKRRSQIKYAAAHPEVVKAHLVTRSMNLRGDTCEGCGDTNGLHAHHPDYKQPTKVVTLCVGCHEAVHHV